MSFGKFHTTSCGEHLQRTFSYCVRCRGSHRSCSVRKGVLRNFENSQENTCARIPFLIGAFIKKRLGAFCEISKKTFFTEHLWVTASAVEQ